MKLNLNLIQSIRLVHALAESDFSVHVPHEEVWRFASLRTRFPIDLSDTPGPLITKRHLSVDHPTPRTTIGSHTRPLVFPHKILAACRNRWIENRTIHTFFSGLITSQRQATIHDWIDRRSAGQRRSKVPITDSRPHRAIRAIRVAMGKGDRNTYPLRGGSFVMSSSHAGRQFPSKAWDQTYYDTMCRSRFALCPNGDFVWTYRFFEATMCGAIPIVEQPCALYDGFHYHMMDDDDYAWSADKAQHNYELCAQRLTIPLADLNRELTKIIELTGSRVTSPAQRQHTAQ